MTSTPLLCLTARASLARPFLFAGAVLLMLDGSAIAQTPIKAEKTKRTLIVSDAVQLSGSKISGGWREHAVDGSWRSVAFVLGDNVATVTFGDGEKGRRAPSATRYVYAGPGGKAAKAGDAPAVYSETHVLADATPGILDKANQSSQVPADVATRVRELGGDIKLMQQAADLKRISELGSALDAAGSRAADDRFFGDRPGGPPRRSGGGWKDPRAGVGRDGRAGDDVVIFEKAGTDEHGNYAYTIVTRHDDGSTTTDRGFRDTSGSTATTSEDKDASGRVTGGSQDTSGGPGGGSSSARYTRNPDTNVEVTTATATSPDGSTHGSVTILYPDGKRRTVESSTPSEVPFSGSGGFDEAWMDKSLPWFMDAVYSEWKRKNDLRKSGGMIAQPGRGEQPSPATSEGPRVGASAVTNCGDTGTNPCARFEGTEVDGRRGWNSISQPLPDFPTAGPLGGKGVPDPLPIPPPKQ
jgi:hypothetical protein